MKGTWMITKYFDHLTFIKCLFFEIKKVCLIQKF